MTVTEFYTHRVRSSCRSEESSSKHSANAKSLAPAVSHAREIDLVSGMEKYTVYMLAKAKKGTQGKARRTVQLPDQHAATACLTGKKKGAD
jgi:hypothetical protein